MGYEKVLSVHRYPPLDRRPDRTVLLDMDPVTSLTRARRRNQALGSSFSEGRFEAEELAFHERVREGYLLLAGQSPERFRVIDADGDMNTVEGRVWDSVRDLVEAVH
jgi:dTMP kinase